MRFSVVVPTYNRPDTLRLCLEALAAQTHADYEVIVVNDGGSDTIAAMMAQQFPQFTYIRQANRGPAAARNAGIGHAGGEVVAFTDDDCVAPPEWLTALAAGYARHPEVAGVGGYLKAPADKLRTNMLAQYEQYVSHTIYGADASERLGGFECPAGGTNNMSYRRSILDAVGGFDETFRYAAGEDADLKWRICQRGARLLYVPVVVTHLQPYSWAAFRRQQIVRGRGVVHFERKHLGLPPSRGRIVLRLAKRKLLFLRDVVMGPQRSIAFVHFIAGCCDCLGQWQEVSKG